MIRTLLVAGFALLIAACGRVTVDEDPDTRSWSSPVALNVGSHESRATFETWVKNASHVFIGRVESVRDKEPFSAGGPQRLREFSVRVEGRLKGLVIVGESIPVLQGDLYPDGRITERDIGAIGLFVASQLTNVRSADGTRSYPEVLGLVTAASYLQEEVSGRLLGIRFFSPYAESFGYDGSRAVIMERLQGGLAVRPVDASPWSDLLSRVEHPSADVEDHLGWDEVRPTGDVPAAGPILGPPLDQDRGGTE